MSERFCPNPAVLEKIRTGPLGAHIDAVVGELSDRGYAKSTSSYALRLIAALGTWLEQSASTGADLDEGTVDAFLTCRYRGRRPHRGDRAILAFFLALLRRTGVLAGAEAPPVADPIAPLREAFRQHLIGQRDLAPTTLRRHVDMAARFLDWRFGAQLPPSLSVLCADDVNRFMLEQARRYCAGHTHLIASALRSFLRFLLQQGAIAVDLARSVPSPTRRQLTGLPRFMPAEDVERLLSSVDRTHP